MKAVTLAREAVHVVGRAFRETGQGFDRLGLIVAENEIYRDSFSRHRPVMNISTKKVNLSGNVFVAPSAAVVGNVEIGSGSTVWYGSVVRGDQNKVTVGENTNIQDRTVIQCSQNPIIESHNSQGAFASEVNIGSFVTIGHGAMMNSCTVGDNCLIGQGSIIQEGCQVHSNSMIAAGAVLLKDTVVESGQLWGGNPAVFVRDVKPDELSFIRMSAEHYKNLGDEHQQEFVEFEKTYQS